MMIESLGIVNIPILVSSIFVRKAVFTTKILKLICFIIHHVPAAQSTDTNLLLHSVYNNKLVQSPVAQSNTLVRDREHAKNIGLTTSGLFARTW